MLDIPSDIDFGQVVLNQTYVRAIDVRNPLSCPVRFSVRPGSDRFSVSPCDDLTVQADSSIRLIIRLRILKAVSKPRDSRTKRDIFHVKSNFFEQKFYASYDFITPNPSEAFNQSQESTNLAVADNARLLTKPRLVRTPSPARSDEVLTLKSWRSASPPQTGQSEAAARPPKPLQALQLPASSVSTKKVEQEVQIRLSQERKQFEQDSAKALEILLEKDQQILQLQQELQTKARAPIMNPEAQLMLEELESRVALLQNQVKETDLQAEKKVGELKKCLDSSKEENSGLRQQVCYMLPPLFLVHTSGCR